MRNKRFYSFFIGILILLSIDPVSSYAADGNNPVRIADQNLIVFPSDVNTIEIVQTTTFVNNGDEKEAQLPIYLPSDYSKLQIRGGLKEEDMKKTEKGIVDTSGLNPGEEKQILLSYQMPMDKNESKWAIEQSYVTDRLQVVIQPGILSFTASDLITQSDLFEMNGQEFRRFTRLNIHPGESWTLSFRFIADQKGEAEQPAPANDGKVIQNQRVTEDGFRIIGKEGIGYGKAAVTIMIIIIAFSAALIGLRRDLQDTIGLKKKTNSSWLKIEKEELLSNIVQLETDYRAQLISDSTYEMAKKKLRDKLIHVSAELKKRS